MRQSSGGHGAVVSIDLGGTSFKAGIVDRSGRILARARVPTPREKDPSMVFAAITGLIDELERKCPAERDGKPMGIALGVPGVVEESSGDVINCFNIFGSHQRVGLRRELEARTGRATKVDKDLNLAAMGEHWKGAGKGCSSLLCVFIGTGIGSGLIVDGKVVRGAAGAAGEIGHLTVERDGPLCGCGNRGCLEQLASGPAIARRMVQEGARQDISPAEVFDMARNEDPVASKVIAEASMYLGIGLADAMTLLNPGLVILGGGVARQLDLLIGPVLAEIRRRCRPAVVESARVVASGLGDDAPLVGGARFFFGEQGGAS